MPVKWSDIYFQPAIGTGDPHCDYRARVARLQAEDAERRQHALNEQSSLAHTPAERIRIWERLHAVNMPRQDDHALLAVIAADTGLTPDQIGAEQKQRRTGAVPVVPPGAADMLPPVSAG